MNEVGINITSAEIYRVIFYKGQVTEIVDADVGIYVIDNKLILFFTVLNSLKRNLKEHDKIFLSNVHFMVINNQKFLIVCALSTLIDNFNEDEVPILHKNSKLDDHKLCFQDKLSKDCYINFNPYVVKQYLWNLFYHRHFRNEVQASWDIDFCENSSSVLHSVDMCKKSFSEGYEVPSIAFLLSKAKKEIVWNKHSSSVDHCIVKSSDHYSLVGFLHVIKNGCIALSDSYTVLPCVFIDDLTPDSDSKIRNLLCEVSSGTVGYYIATKEYCFVFENFLDSTCALCNYICIRMSCFTALEKHSKSQNFHLYEDLPNNQYSSELNSEKTAFSPHSMDFSKFNKGTVNSPSNVFINETSRFDNLYLLLEFNVIHKMWSCVNNKIGFSKALVILFKKELISVDKADFTCFVKLHKIQDIAADESDELSDLMSTLNLEQEPKITILDFLGSSSKCSNLLPMHLYKMFIPYQSKDVAFKQKKPCTFSHSHEQHAVSVISINLAKSIKIIHSVECTLQDKRVCDNSFISIQSVHNILHNHGNISKIDRIRGVLLEKSFEKDFNSDDKILRLVLKDLYTSDVVNVYIFYYPDFLFGLLPGVTLELIGIICITSQKGNHYLRSSNVVGLHILDIHNSSMNIISRDPSRFIECNKDMFWLSSLNIAECPLMFECFHGFVLKITTAHLSLTCSRCLKCIENHCICAAKYMEMVEVSFEVDDGTNRITMHGSSKILKFLLKLSEVEWNALAKHVAQSKQCLKFSTVKKSVSPQPFMNRLFHCLCNNPAIKRPVRLNCCLQKISDGKNQLIYSCICKDIADINVQDITAKLYVSLTKQE